MKNNVKDLLAYLEGFISENRKTGFLRVVKKRKKKFTKAIEDVY